MTVPLSRMQAQDVAAIRARLEEDVAGKATLAAAAQAFTQTLVRELEGLVLARTYAVMPARMLTPDLRGWASELALAKGLLGSLTDDTPTLTLLGTAGAERAWNSRHLSQGHKAVPLLSAAFVSQVPMVAAMLRALGLGLEWLDQRAMSHVEKHLGNLMGMFFVQDAASTRDPEGRLIIPAQDFVRVHKVHSVFGFGSSYVGGALVVLILFSNENLEKGRIERITPLLSAFKARTGHLMRKETLFEES